MVSTRCRTYTCTALATPKLPNNSAMKQVRQPFLPVHGRSLDGLDPDVLLPRVVHDALPDRFRVPVFGKLEVHFIFHPATALEQRRIDIRPRNVNARVDGAHDRRFARRLNDFAGHAVRLIAEAHRIAHLRVVLLHERAIKQGVGPITVGGRRRGGLRLDRAIERIATLGGAHAHQSRTVRAGEIRHR
jgi:hypothetical protein